MTRWYGDERSPIRQPSYDGPERRAIPDPTGLDRGRSSGLDGLRALAALLVVAFHLHTVSRVSFGPLDAVVRGGDTGVYLFFALSGYLLYRPFLRGPVDLVSYGLKRAGRIVPGYYVALIGLAVLTSSRLPLDNPLPFLTMSAGSDLTLRHFLGNAWTLTAEVLFYLSLPFIARVAHGREVQVLLGLGAASTAVVVVYRLTMTPENAWLVLTYPMVFYAFIPGMLLAVLDVRHPFLFQRLERWPYLALGVTFVTMGTLTSILPVALLTGVGAILLMGWLAHHPLPGARALAFAGGASYALYLWHKDAFVVFGPTLGLGIAIVAAALSWALVERPILARAHALVARRRIEVGLQPVPFPTR